MYLEERRDVIKRYGNQIQMSLFLKTELDIVGS